MTSATVAAPKVCPSCGARYTTDALFCPNDGTPLTTGQQAGSEHSTSDAPDPYLGREISGHIQIRQLAGIGAMGRVYRAFQRGIDRDVAVKILHRELSANQQLVARFHREAKVASRLQHPNVVQVHLAGQLPDGALYIVMEFLDGLSLQSALAAVGGSMPLPRALHVALQICDATGEAHAQGIVHRDLKPENVMLIKRGEDVDYVKVLDFGIARLNWGEQSMATAAGLIFGTARYISPEGAQGEQVGPAGDVYAIATLLYQMLSGRTPFEGDQAVALLVQQIHDTPPPLRSIPRAAYVPEAIAALIMKNLAKDPAARAEDARALGRQIIDAAKASGMSPDDLVSRSVLLGVKGPMQLPPANRTKQLPLRDDGTSQALPGRGLHQEATPPPGRGSHPSAQDRLSPEPARVGPPSDDALDAARAASKAPPTASTTKWVPPAELKSQLTKPQPPGTGTARIPPAQPPPAGEKPKASLDPTLDDEPAPPPRAQMSSSPRVRTEFAEPSPVANLPYFPAPADGTSQPLPGRDRTSPRPPQASQPGVPMKPPSSVESTLSDEEAEDAPRRARSRAFVIVLLCFLLGVVITSAVLYRIGRLGPMASQGTLDDYVSRAEDAMRHKRWDAPPVENVKDLTTEGLNKWPKDPRLLDVRARSTDELVKEAVGQKFNGDLNGALHLARLANELDPTDTIAQHLLQDYEQEAKKGPDTTVTPLPVDAGAANHVPSGKPAPPTGPPRAALDVSVLKPRIGQPVSFVARVSSGTGAALKTPIDDAHFNMSGPGLAPETKLGAVGDGPGVYRTAFTFFEGGRYDVSFNARVEGVQLKATRVLVVDDSAPAPPPSNGSLPPPTPSGKWLRRSSPLHRRR